MPQILISDRSVLEDMFLQNVLNRWTVLWLELNITFLFSSQIVRGRKFWWHVDVEAHIVGGSPRVGDRVATFGSGRAIS